MQLLMVSQMNFLSLSLLLHMIFICGDEINQYWKPIFLQKKVLALSCLKPILREKKRENTWSWQEFQDWAKLDILPRLAPEIATSLPIGVRCGNTLRQSPIPESRSWKSRIYTTPCDLSNSTKISTNSETEMLSTEITIFTSQILINVISWSGTEGSWIAISSKILRWQYCNDKVSEDR